MFRYLPEATRNGFAATEEEARQWVEDSVAGRKTAARRPPELSTRDNVARAIYTEVKEGRGSPHGGAFLDISYLPAERVIRKLPSMYHQFKDLADVDITKTPMEVGPTTHYTMGGARVDPDTGACTVTGLFAAGECTGGMHGANRLGGNSLSDIVVFGRRAGMGAAEFAKQAALAPLPQDQVDRTAAELTAPFERDGEDPYAVQRDLQETMQSLVGIFREEPALKQALEKLGQLQQRASKVHVDGSRMFNPGWHLAWDLRHMLFVSEAITRAALERKESRGAHSRLDHPQTDPEQGTFNVCVRKLGDGMAVVRTPLPQMPQELAGLFAAGKT